MNLIVVITSTEQGGCHVTTSVHLSVCLFTSLSCLSVCLSVSQITEKVVNRFWSILVDRLVMVQGGTIYILVVIQSLLWIPDHY